jgi:hypothetical protein
LCHPTLAADFSGPGTQGSADAAGEFGRGKMTHKVSNMIQLKFEDLVEDYLNLFQNSSTYI